MLLSVTLYLDTANPPLWNSSGDPTAPLDDVPPAIYFVHSQRSEMQWQRGLHKRPTRQGQVTRAVARQLSQ